MHSNDSRQVGEWSQIREFLVPSRIDDGYGVDRPDGIHPVLGELLHSVRQLIRYGSASDDEGRSTRMAFRPKPALHQHTDQAGDRECTCCAQPHANHDRAWTRGSLDGQKQGKRDQSCEGNSGLNRADFIDEISSKTTSVEFSRSQKHKECGHEQPRVPTQRCEAPGQPLHTSGYADGGGDHVDSDGDDRQIRVVTNSIG